MVSPLVIQEYIFAVSKLRIEPKMIESDLNFYAQFAMGEITVRDVMEAYRLCAKVGSCKNINDAVHVVFAQDRCDRLLTFDADFKRFADHTLLEIEILSA